jgi:uncharacterized coiled-coil protein SlyX
MDSCRNPQVTLDEMLKWKKRTEHLETQLAAQADEIDQLKAVVDNLKEEITDKDCTIGSQAELIREVVEVMSRNNRLLKRIWSTRPDSWTGDLVSELIACGDSIQALLPRLVAVVGEKP